jgi:hypothetical protein
MEILYRHSNSTGGVEALTSVCSVALALIAAASRRLLREPLQPSMGALGLLARSVRALSVIRQLIDASLSTVHNAGLLSFEFAFSTVLSDILND